MKLFPHQVDALKRTQDSQCVAYYHDMGLGKTFTGAEKMVSYGNRVNLIVCQKSKVVDWFNHFVDHYSGCGYTFNNLRNKLELEYFLDCAMNPNSTLKLVGIVNYETCWRRKELLNLKDFTLMLDESSLIQNKTAKQTKFILKLKPKNVILLSGTPTAGKYENLWTQAQLLGWNITEDLYEKQYVNWKWIEADGYWQKVVDKDDPYKNVERLKQKFRDHGADFVKTEEVFDLPEQTFTTVNCASSKEYRKFMKTGYVQMSDGTELIGDQVFTKRLYARQLCGMYSQAKLEAFRELIQSTNDRVIVFYNFNAELMELENIVWSLGRKVSVVNGSRKDLTAYEQDDDSVTLIQYQAGAMGLNLQKANKMIYFSLPERSDLFEQSKKRIHRIGQNRPCFYWIMMCVGSVEEQIYQTLLERKDYTDNLFVKGGYAK